MAKWQDTFEQLKKRKKEMDMASNLSERIQVGNKYSGNTSYQNNSKSVLPNTNLINSNVNKAPINNLDVTKILLGENNTIKTVQPTVTSKKDKNAIDQILGTTGYVAKEFGTEFFGGASKIPYAVTSEVGANLEKGKDKSFGENAKDLWKAVATVGNPFLALKNLTENVVENAKEQAKTDKSTTNKILGTLFDTITEDNAIDKAIQTVGSVTPDGTGKKIQEAGEKVLTPYNNLRKDLNKEKEEQGKAGKLLGTVSGVIGNMGPSIATTALTKNPNLGLMVMGASAKGGATNEALQNGADLETATKYGDIVGATEMLTEKLTGGLKVFGGGALDDVVLGSEAKKGLVNKINNEFLKKAAVKGYEYGGEVAEELISDIVGMGAQKGSWNENSSYSWEDAGETTLVTLLSTLVLNMLTKGKAGVVNADGTTNTQIDSETVINDTISQAEKELGRKLNDNEKNIIASQVDSINKVIQAQEDIAPVNTEQVQENVVKVQNNEELNNIATQINQLEDQLDTSQNAVQQQETLNQIKALEQQYNEIQQQNEIAPVVNENQQISNTTTQEVNSNLATEVESNTLNNEKTNISDELTKEIQYKTRKANENKENVEFVPVSELSQLKKGGGYRTSEEINKLTDNIKSNGILTPIELEKTSDGSIRIENGNHRLQIANELGLTEVPVKYVNSEMENIDNSQDILYNDENEKSLNYVEGEFESGNRNRSDVNQRNVRSEFNEENSTNNNVTFENKGTAGKNDKVSDKVSGYNDGSSSTSTYEQNTKGLDNSSFFDKDIAPVEANDTQETQNGTQIKSLEERVSGDALLDAQDFIDEVKSVGANVDKNGYITVYHQTTNENAEKIKQTGKMSAKEPYVYFSTSKDASQSDGRGQAKLEFKIPAEKLLLDDIFSDNADVKVSLKGSKELDVSDYLIKETQSISEKPIQGLENYSREEIKDFAKDYIEQKLEENDLYDVDIADVEIHGSRNRGTARGNSDLDIVVEYKGDIREDTLFDILNEDPMYIDDIKVDINPITENDTGTLKDYMERSNKYDEEILSKQEKTDKNSAETLQAAENTTPTQQELDSLEDIRQNKSGSEYANAFYNLEKKYGKANLYKGLNEYKSTGKALNVEQVTEQVKESIAPLKETLEEVKKTVEEVKQIKEDLAPIIEGYTQEDVNLYNQKNFDNLQKQDIAPIENTTPEYQYENDNEGNQTKVESPLSDRNIEDVGSKKVKAYQYEHPEVRPYFQEQAQYMLNDLQNSIKGKRMPIYDDVGNMTYIGTTRQTTTDIAELLDSKYNYSYADIKKGLNAIIEDHGAENTAIAKRIEFALDERLRNGYTDVAGFKIPPNQEYLNVLKGQEYSNYYNSIPTNENIGSEINENQDNLSEIAPVNTNILESEKVSQNKQYEAITPNEEFDNGGPMLKVTPEMRESFDKAVENSAKEVEKELGYTPKNPTLESTYEDDFVPNYEPLLEYMEELARRREARKKGIDPNTINNQLTDTSKEKQASKLKQAWLTYKSLFTNNKAVYDEIAKETKNNEIKYKADRLNTVYGETADVTSAQLDNNFNPIGKSINGIFENAESQGLGEAGQDFLYHLSNINRHSRGKGSANVSQETSQSFVDNFKSQYPELAKQLQEDIQTWNKNRRENLVDAGLISEETSQLFEELDADYVPFFASDKEYKPTYTDVGEIKPNQVAKRAIGGSKDVLSVKQAMIKQLMSDKRAIAQNDLYKELIKSYGNQANVGADVRTKVTDMSDSLYADTNGDKYLTAYVDGERKSIKISDYMYDNIMQTENIENTIKNIENQFSFVTKPLQKFSSFVRNIHTNWSPTFVITNPMKDIQDAPLNSKNAAKFLKNYPSAYTDVNYAKNVNKYATKFKQLTGQEITSVNNTSNLSSEAKSLYNKYQDGSLWNKFVAGYGNVKLYGDTYNNMDQLIAKETSPKGKSKFSKTLEGFSNANEFMELATRYAEFKSSVESGASISEAFYNAKDVTTNFGRGGVITKALNRNGATFLNASVQGFSKFVRNFSGENGAKGVVGSLAKAVTLGVVPAIFNHLAFGDDDDYEELPNYIKDNYYLIKTDDGEFIRIPKGRMLSVFGSAGRRTLELADGDKDAFKGYLQNAYSQSGPNNPLENNVFSPLIQAKNNEAWYGGDLIPTRLQKKPTEEQYDESTDEFSKWLGKKIGVSPYKINYVLDQYTGGIGDIFLPMMTEESTNDADTFGEQLLAPVKDKFTTNSTMKNKYAGEFYDTMDELSTKASSSKATEEDELKSKYMSSVSYEMSQLYKEKHEIQSDSSLSKSEKYKKVQEIQKQINSIAKDALETYENGTFTKNYSSIGNYEYYKSINNDGEEEWRKVKDEEAEELAKLGMTSSEKNNYFSMKQEFSTLNNNYHDSKDELKTKYGTDSDEYKEELSNLYLEKKNTIIDKILESDFTDDEKAYIYDKYYSSDSINTVVSSGIGIDYLLDYEKNDFKADYNNKGKAINNSRKNKVISYVNEYDLGIAEKAILIKSTNSFKFNDYNQEIVDYVDKLDTSYEEKVNILKSLDMKILDDGTVRW